MSGTAAKLPLCNSRESSPGRGGMIPKQSAVILRIGKTGRTRPRFAGGQGTTKMKTRLGTVILSALLYAQGLLGIAAVAAVLMKEPVKEHHAAQSAAVEGLVTVQ